MDPNMNQPTGNNSFQTESQPMQPNIPQQPSMNQAAPKSKNNILVVIILLIFIIGIGIFAYAYLMGTISIPYISKNNTTAYPTVPQISQAVTSITPSLTPSPAQSADQVDVIEVNSDLENLDSDVSGL